MTTITSTSHHRYHSLGNIPFSWENSPGISKVAPRFDDDSPTAPCTYVDVDVDVVDHHRKLSMIAKPIVEKLPPPPPPLTDHNDSRPTKYFSGGRSNLLMPLPPCMFHAPPPPQQPHHRRSTSKAYRPRKGDDPFLAAYKECTKSFNKEKKGTAAKESKKGSRWLGLGFSCKHGSSGVRDDSMVMVSSSSAAAAARSSGGLLIRDSSLERSRNSGIVTAGMAVGGHRRLKSMSI